MKKRIKIPKFLQGVLWSVPVEMLDLKKDKVYIINQVLAYGTLTMWQWLFANYHLSTISQVFAQKPYPDYTDTRFYLLKDDVLPLTRAFLDPKKYVRAPL